MRTTSASTSARIRSVPVVGLAYVSWVVGDAARSARKPSIDFSIMSAPYEYRYFFLLSRTVRQFFTLPKNEKFLRCGSRLWRLYFCLGIRPYICRTFLD